MIRQILEKWFGLDPRHCDTCEVYREQLAKSERERSELLHRLLDKDKAEPQPPVPLDELRSIQPAFVPWRVKQQMLEQEDRKSAQLLRDKEKEIAELEQELGVGVQ